ncbi:hypothetical protein F4811DRAFT_279909 [Daldinia bambusicola]|nr:hypothetical protein F4811DRAFT_279909 [Daldinia bambusicola]
MKDGQPHSYTTLDSLRRHLRIKQGKLYRSAANAKEPSPPPPPFPRTLAPLETLLSTAKKPAPQPSSLPTPEISLPPLNIPKATTSKMEEIFAELLSTRNLRDASFEQLRGMVAALDPAFRGALAGGREVCQEIEKGTDALNFAVQRLQHLAGNGPRDELAACWKAFAEASDNARLGHHVWTADFDCGFVIKNWDWYAARHAELKAALDQLMAAMTELLLDQAQKQVRQRWELQELQKKLQEQLEQEQKELQQQQQQQPQELQELQYEEEQFEYEQYEDQPYEDQPIEDEQ